MSTNIINGLNHLEGLEVVVWADGVDLSPTDEEGVQRTYTVTNGLITLDVEITHAIVGLPYTGRWKSAKLGLQTSEINTTLTQEKRISHVGLVMAYVHAKGLKYGPDFDHLNDLPEIEKGTEVDPDEVRAAYDESEIEFPGVWLTDLRLCLEAQAPRPVTILAAVPDLEIS